MTRYEHMELLLKQTKISTSKDTFEKLIKELTLNSKHLSPCQTVDIDCTGLHCKYCPLDYDIFNSKWKKWGKDMMLEGKMVDIILEVRLLT